MSTSSGTNGLVMTFKEKLTEVISFLTTLSPITISNDNGNFPVTPASVI
jgi:hypothetical protein